MGIRDRFRRLFTVTNYTPEPTSWAGAANAPAEQLASVASVLSTWQTDRPTWPTWDPARSARDSYHRMALIYRCLNLIAYQIGTAPVKVKNDLTDKPIDRHPMRGLLRRPNVTMGEAAFYGAMTHRALCSGFAVAEKERNALGETVALWPLQSSWLKADKRRDGRYDWQYQIPGYAEAFPLKAENVVHWKWSDTASGSPYGLAPLEVCLRETSIGNAMLDYLKLFFERGAVPLHALVLDTWPGQTLSQNRIEEITENFVSRHTGLANSAEPMVLQGIKEVKRIGFDLNELAYVDLHDLTELGIVQAFGIPATVAQIRVGLEHSDSRANATTDQTAFYRNCIIPAWSRLDDALEIQLLPEFDDNPDHCLYFDTTDIAALQEDRAEMAAWLGSGVTGGYVSAHTFHAELGLPQPEGDDYYLRPLSLEAIPVTDPIPEPAPIPAALVPFAGGEPPPAEGDSAQPGTPAESESAVPSYQVLEGNGPRRRYAQAGKERKILDRVAKSRTPSIAKFLEGQAQRIADADWSQLAAADPDNPTEAAAPFVNWVDEDIRLEKVIQTLYDVAGNAALVNMEPIYGVDPKMTWDVANPHVRQVKAKLGKKMKDINVTTRKAVQKIVTEGLAQGVAIDDIRANIQKDTTFSRNRASVVARTESMFAYGEANALGFGNSGVVDRAQIFDNPAHTDDYKASDGLTCATRDGIICPLDQMMGHIYADHPNGSAVGTPVLEGEDGDAPLTLLP